MALPLPKGEGRGEGEHEFRTVKPISLAPDSELDTTVEVFII